MVTYVLIYFYKSISTHKGDEIVPFLPFPKVNSRKPLYECSPWVFLWVLNCYYAWSVQQPRWQCLRDSLGKGGQTLHGRGWWREHLWGMALWTSRGEEKEEEGTRCPRYPHRDSPAACGETMLEKGEVRGKVLFWLAFFTVQIYQ